MKISQESRHVRVDLDTLRISGGGTITGIICFDIDGRFFPEAKWNDFVAIILSWWLEAVRKLIDGVTSTEKLFFMDGPFLLTVCLSGQAAAVKFMKHAPQSEIASSEVKFRDLVTSILSAGKEVLSHCVSSGWQSEEIRYLENLVREVDQLFKSSYFFDSRHNLQ